MANESSVETLLLWPNPEGNVSASHLTQCNPRAKQPDLDFQLPGVRLIVWLGHKRRNPINPPHGAMAPSPELPSSPDLPALLILL